MGDRAEIYFQEHGEVWPICIYTHWGGLGDMLFAVSMLVSEIPSGAGIPAGYMGATGTLYDQMLGVFGVDVSETPTPRYYNGTGDFVAQVIAALKTGNGGVYVYPSDGPDNASVILQLEPERWVSLDYGSETIEGTPEEVLETVRKSGEAFGDWEWENGF